jgi:hypothetical protein
MRSAKTSLREADGSPVNEVMPGDQDLLETYGTHDSR